MERSPSPNGSSPYGGGGGGRQMASPDTRSRSPLLFNETAKDESPLYQAAMAKVYEASWKFDRGKNGDFLKVGVANFKMIAVFLIRYYFFVYINRIWTIRNCPKIYFVR